MGDWRTGEVEAIPGKTMPKFKVQKRDYSTLYEQMTSLGEAMRTNGVGAHGLKIPVEDFYDELARKQPDEASRDAGGVLRPSLKRGRQVAEAILALDPASNGELAHRAFEAEEAKTGLSLTHLGAGQRDIRTSFADIVAQPRRILTTPTWSGIVTKGRAYNPFTLNVEHLIPWRTLTGRQHLYLDHEQYLAWGEHLPVYKPRPDHTMLSETEESLAEGQDGRMFNYITPHGKWSIHSTYSENDRMMTLSRGGYPIWMNVNDASRPRHRRQRLGRALQRQRRVRPTLHHLVADTRGAPSSSTTHRSGRWAFRSRRGARHAGGHEQLADTNSAEASADERRVRPVLLRLQLLGSDRGQPGHVRVRPPHRQAEVLRGIPMRVRAQMSMLFHLDKCIGCHTCSVACKNLWTDREGAEYMWWNNVETRPGTGYPTGWEDQEHYKGGWRRDKKGRLKLTLHSRGGGVAKAFYNPSLPELEDYYDPFTFKYGDLFTSPQSTQQPTAVPISKITGDEMEITTGPNWDDDLGGFQPLCRQRSVDGGHRPGHPGTARRDRAGRLQLPAPHLQSLPEPVVRRRLPERCDLQASRRRRRPRQRRQVSRLAHVRLGLPIQEGLLQLDHRQVREMHSLLPPTRDRTGTGRAPTRVSAAFATWACSCTTPTGSLRLRRHPTTNCSTLSSTSSSIRTTRRWLPQRSSQASTKGGSIRRSAPRSTSSSRNGGWHSRSTPSTARWR